MITFVECQQSGYPTRTAVNVKQADLTIAIATDFNTPGEKLTKNLVGKYKKLYAAVHYQHLNAKIIMQASAKTLGALANKPKIINIAGNGIYTLLQPQPKIDELVYNYLAYIMDNSKGFENLELIRSGGQTGIDEAGLKAAVKLGIPALCFAPKGWMFRGINGKDIKNEQLFKARFDHIL